MGSLSCALNSGYAGLEIPRDLHHYRGRRHFVRDSLEGTQINLASSGEALRCFCYLSDATRAFLYLITFGEPAQAYDLANANAEISIRDLAGLGAGLTDPPLEVSMGNSENLKPGYLPSQVPRSLPSIAKVQDLGWHPVVGLEDGFRRTLFSYRNQIRCSIH